APWNGQSGRTDRRLRPCLRARHGWLPRDSACGRDLDPRACAMTDPMREIAVPTPDPESAPFWEAAQEGVFLLPRCNDCQTYYWYPRANCPHCLGIDTDWVESKGRGRIYSLTVMRKTEVPYCIAYVE